MFAHIYISQFVPSQNNFKINNIQYLIYPIYKLTVLVRNSLKMFIDILSIMLYIYIYINLFVYILYNGQRNYKQRNHLFIYFLSLHMLITKFIFRCCIPITITLTSRV